MVENIEKSWRKALKNEFQKPYFKELTNFVKSEYKVNTIYPEFDQIFNAFNYCSFDEVKVVIIGQDPYHGENQANGLSFSVNDKVRIPPSLKNIYKELYSDIGKELTTSGNLEHWAKQGVFLLNATLTVRSKSPGSHQNKGWEVFTDSVIQLISDKKSDVVFLLWGAYAAKKGLIIDRGKHKVLESAHPSPFSAYRGFLGNKHFSQTNTFLKGSKKEFITW